MIKMDKSEEDEELEEITEAEYIRVMHSAIKTQQNSMYTLNNQYKSAYQKKEQQLQTLYSLLNDLDSYKEDHYIRYYQSKSGMTYEIRKKKAIGFET